MHILASGPELFLKWRQKKWQQFMHCIEKELLDIRTAITHLRLDKHFLQQTRRTRYSPNIQQGRHPRYLREEATQVQRTKSRVPGQDPEKASGEATVTVNTTRQREIIGK